MILAALPPRPHRAHPAPVPSRSRPRRPPAIAPPATPILSRTASSYSRDTRLRHARPAACTRALSLARHCTAVHSPQPLRLQRQRRRHRVGQPSESTTGATAPPIPDLLRRAPSPTQPISSFTIHLLTIGRECMFVDTCVFIFESFRVQIALYWKIFMEFF